MSGKSELILFGESNPPQVVVEQGIFCDINPVSGVDGPTLNSLSMDPTMSTLI
jgi:hypothetical protein